MPMLQGKDLSDEDRLPACLPHSRAFPFLLLSLSLLLLYAKPIGQLSAIRLIPENAALAQVLESKFQCPGNGFADVAPWQQQ